MAEVTSFRKDAMPAINSGIVHVQKVLSVINGSAALADTITVMALAPKAKMFLDRGVVRTSGTLGAGATVQLRAAGTAVTPATTAAAASKVDSDTDADVPMALSGLDKIDLLVGGAGITAAATITVDLYFSARE